MRSIASILLRSELVGRAVLGLMAVCLLSLGIWLVTGDLRNYRGGSTNFWGPLAAAPLGILVGLGLLYLVLFQWKRLSGKAAVGRRLRGRDARRAQRAAEDRSPVQDYDRPWNG